MNGCATTTSAAHDIHIIKPDFEFNLIHMHHHYQGDYDYRMNEWKRTVLAFSCKLLYYLHSWEEDQDHD